MGKLPALTRAIVLANQPAPSQRGCEKRLKGGSEGRRRKIPPDDFRAKKKTSTSSISGSVFDPSHARRGCHDRHAPWKCRGPVSFPIFDKTVAVSVGVAVW